MENSIASTCLKLLTCQVCSKIASEAVETSCCHSIFCKACLKPNQSCPSCNAANYNLTPCHLARKIVNTMPAQCPYECGTVLTREDLEQHKKKCHNRDYTCSSKGCEFKGSLEGYKSHIIQAHSADIVEAFDALEIEKKFSKKGKVSGYYRYDSIDYPIEGTYQMEKGKMTLNTVDNVGPAEWRGYVDIKNRMVKMIKTYIGAHSVEYSGRINEKLAEIEGQWTIEVGYGDNFKLILA